MRASRTSDAALRMRLPRGPPAPPARPLHLATTLQDMARSFAAAGIPTAILVWARDPAATYPRRAWQGQRAHA